MDIALSDFTHCESDSPPGQGDESMYDLVLKQARVIDPQENLDEVRDIAFRDGNVAAIEKYRIILKPGVATLVQARVKKHRIPVIRPNPM